MEGRMRLNWNGSRIELRAWCPNKSEWIDRDASFILEWSQVSLYTDERPLIIQQWTGAYDKNGVKIFEGDIVAYYEWDDEEPVVKVIVPSKNYPGGYYITDPDFDVDKYGCGDYCSLLGYYHRPADWEVIGNIMENPELIKEALFE